jgi:transposase-like protein
LSKRIFMALTDNPNTKHRKPKIRSTVAGTNRSWSDKQKIEAVQSYMALGNLALTSRLLNIPEITLRVWKTTEWWKTVTEDLKLQENVQMTARLKKIVDASLGVVEDRLVNGDLIYDQKTGQMIRKPVNMKDAHKVSVDLMDKKKILEKASEPAEQEVKDDERLLKLAEKFANFVTQKKEPLPQVEVIDVEVKEPTSAVHEEWEEGLQDGVREVPQSSGTNQESDRADNAAPTSQ